MSHRLSRPLAYGCSVLVSIIGLSFATLAATLFPTFRETSFEILAVVSAVAALIGGFGPGVVATIICWIGGATLVLGRASLVSTGGWMALPSNSLLLPTGLMLSAVVAWTARHGTLTGPRDVTTMIRIMDKLRLSRNDAIAASRAKSEYLASMTHEIRTPLSAIIGFSELLLEPQQTEAERLDFVHIIRRNGELLSQIIGNVLDISKIEAGRMEIEILRVNVHQVIRDVCDSLSLRAAAKGLTLDCDFRDVSNNLEIATDPTRFKQILVNVAVNAIKFTERGGVTIVVRTPHLRDASMRERQLEVLVKDTGIGLTQAQAARLFQSYTQADKATARTHGGTGLGLSLSRHLARLLGGELDLIESQPGKGSTFRLRLSLETRKNTGSDDARRSNIRMQEQQMAVPAPS